MDIEASLWGNLEDRSGQELAKGDQHQHLRSRLSEAAHHLCVSDLLRLDHGKAHLLGRPLDGRRAQRFPPAGRAVRLGHDQRYLVPRLKEAGERGHSECRRPHEDQPHKARTVSSMCVRCVPPQKTRPHPSQ